MSINFTSDINGATSGSGIKKITVGGKTINLSESGGDSTGNGVVSGVFTPTGEEETVTVDTGIDFNFVAFYKKTETLGYGRRTLQGCFWDRASGIYARLTTNAACSADAGVFGMAVSDTETEITGDKYVCAKDGTKLIISSVEATGFLPPEEFQWYAW